MVSELPDVVDLFALVVGTGANVSQCVRSVALRAPPTIGSALCSALERWDGGERLADALSECLGALGEPVRPLAAAVVASERYGVALLPALERLAVDSRAERRRRAEEAARRVPVALLFPLVLCVLPAYLLLTLVPLVASAIGSLGR